jgi:hypothetical protein
VTHTTLGRKLFSPDPIGTMGDGHRIALTACSVTLAPDVSDPVDERQSVVRAQCPLRPTWRASRLFDPLLQLRSLRRLQASYLDIRSPVGRSERRRELEVGTAEEKDIHRNAVGGYSMIHPSSGTP